MIKLLQKFSLAIHKLVHSMYRNDPDSYGYTRYLQCEKCHGKRAGLDPKLLKALLMTTNNTKKKDKP